MLKTAVETLLEQKKLVSVSREWTSEEKESSSFWLFPQNPKLTFFTWSILVSMPSNGACIVS